MAHVYLYKDERLKTFKQKWSLKKKKKILYSWVATIIHK